MIPMQEWHPMLVHFPIVLILLMVAWDAGLALRGVDLQPARGPISASTTIALLAGLSALAAYAAGDMAYDIALSKGVPETLLETHEGLGSTVAACAALWGALRLGLWRMGRPLGGRPALGAVAAEAALAALVVATAWFGGDLVYGHGVAVAAGASGG